MWGDLCIHIVEGTDACLMVIDIFRRVSYTHAYEHVHTVRIQRCIQTPSRCDRRILDGHEQVQPLIAYTCKYNRLWHTHASTTAYGIHMQVQPLMAYTKVSTGYRIDMQGSCTRIDMRVQLPIAYTYTYIFVSRKRTWRIVHSRHAPSRGDTRWFESHLHLPPFRAYTYIYIYIYMSHIGRCINAPISGDRRMCDGIAPMVIGNYHHVSYTHTYAYTHEYAHTHMSEIGRCIHGPGRGDTRILDGCQELPNCRLNHIHIHIYICYAYTCFKHSSICTCTK